MATTLTQSSDILTVQQLYDAGKLRPSEDAPRATSSAAINKRVALWSGDITQLAVDAVVNAANTALMGGGGVDGAIHQAAGPKLAAHCKDLPGCSTGKAVATPGFGMPCRRILHAVGPRYHHDRAVEDSSLLRSAYTSSLELAAETNCRTIAFPCISTGIYGYPSDIAASEALSAVREYLERDAGGRIDKVIFVNFLPIDVAAYESAIPVFFPPDHTIPQSEAESEAPPTAAGLI